VNDLYERIAKTMPADSPGSLRSQTNADIVAYVFQVNRFPAGTEELKADPEAMKAIAIGK
jgi:hypothetical protein